MDHRCRKRVRRILLGFAPGGVYLANLVTQAAGGLLHHRFTLTFPTCCEGGLFSVALARGSPRVAVSHHRIRWSPDVPHPPRRGGRDHPANSSAPLVYPQKRVN